MRNKNQTRREFIRNLSVTALAGLSLPILSSCSKEEAEDFLQKHFLEMTEEEKKQQATSSQSISRNMQVLREISSQTAESTTATSTSIVKLAELAAQLRKSVTGFRLPGGAISATGEYPLLHPGDVPAAAEGAERPRRVSGLPG